MPFLRNFLVIEDDGEALHILDELERMYNAQFDPIT